MAKRVGYKRESLRKDGRDDPALIKTAIDPDDSIVHLKGALQMMDCNVKRYMGANGLYAAKGVSQETEYVLANWVDGSNFLTGRDYLAKRCFHIAIKYFTLAIETNPNFAMAFYGRGVALRSLGMTREADADFRRSVEISPNVLE